MMTTLNNFDCSSTGTNIELNIFWDTDRGASDYDESFANVDNETVFTLFGNLDVSDWEKTFNTPDETKILFKDYLAWYTGKCPSLALFSTIRDLMNELECNMNTPVSELLESIEALECSRSNYVDFLEQNYSPKFFKVTSRGYSQGDCKEIIIPHELLEMNKEEVTQDNANSYSSLIDHLCWDQPLYCRIEVNDEEIDLIEGVKCTYTYDKREIIDNFENAFAGKPSTKSLVSQWLNEHLPQHPKHH